jgi:glycosyltransferase involved in cell wall biosynthesis
MTNNIYPRVYIGMPVYNGERYIQEAIDSILSQTYQDWKLLISDNASTDDTRSICEDYVRRDHRITYRRNEINLGAAKNYNLVFQLTSSEYFKWAAHDDTLAPEFLSKCVAVLDRDPSIILCHSKTGRINEFSERNGSYDYDLRTDSPSALVRYRDLVLKRHACMSIFGVIRRDELQNTPLIGSYVGSDRVLLVELSLKGRIYEAPEYLFFRRNHPQTSVRTFNEYDRLVWFDPNKSGRISLINWKIGLEYLYSVRRAPLKWIEKLQASFILLLYVKNYRDVLSKDIMVAAQRRLSPLNRVFKTDKRTG